MVIEHYLFEIIPYIAALIEIVGTFIISLGVIRTVIKLTKNRFDFSGHDIKLELATALALALEYKLAAEVLKSVVVRTLDEFVVLAAVVVLRVILTAVIHWEIRAAKEEEIRPCAPEGEGAPPAEGPRPASSKEKTR